MRQRSRRDCIWTKNYTKLYNKLNVALTALVVLSEIFVWTHELHVATQSVATKSLIVFGPNSEPTQTNKQTNNNQKEPNRPNTHIVVLMRKISERSTLPCSATENFNLHNENDGRRLTWNTQNNTNNKPHLTILSIWNAVVSVVVA